MSSELEFVDKTVSVMSTTVVNVTTITLFHDKNLDAEAPIILENRTLANLKVTRKIMHVNFFSEVF